MKEGKKKGWGKKERRKEGRRKMENGGTEGRKGGWKDGRTE